MDQFWDQWNKIPLAGKALILVILWATMALGYNFSIRGDQVNKYRGLARQFRQVRRKREKYETIAQNRPRWEAEVARLRGELAKAQTLLPTKKEIPNLLQKIDDLGNKSGLKIGSFLPRRERARGFYSEVPMDMAVNGTFYEVMVFFDKVSNLDRIVNVTRIRLSSPKFKNQKLLLKANFRLITYRFIAPTRRKKKPGKKRGRRRR